MTSAFFWTYTPGQLVAGWVADKLGGYRALALGFSVWSVATALTGLVDGFAMLLALRVLLGVGECTAFPSMSKLLAENYSERIRRKSAHTETAADRDCGAHRPASDRRRRIPRRPGILDLVASRAADLFQRSKAEQKRKLADLWRKRRKNLTPLHLSYKDGRTDCSSGAPSPP